MLGSEYPEKDISLGGAQDRQEANQNLRSYCFFFLKWMHLCGCVHMGAGGSGGQKRVPDPQKLELQVTVN